jgi:hypothetical protein
MATLINTGSQSSVAAGASLTTNSPSATAGNALILQIAWLNANTASTTAPGNITGWTKIYGPTAAKNAGQNVVCGFALYTKTAAGGVESPVFPDPEGGTVDLYAHGIITEWSGMGAHDTQDASASSTNNSAASTTGATIPNTGTLTQANNTVFTGVAIAATTGLANAAIAFSGGSWTTEFADQDTTASVGTLTGHKTVSANTALGAVYTWTSDASMLCYQGAVIVFSDAGGGPPFPPVPEPPFVRANLNPILAR